MSEPYQILIGLEVHVQLLTESKLFCSCSTRFGQPPNTQTCPVCIGMPGTLPVLNRKAFQLALKAALALNCRIARFTKWDRKNYYYPDLPKGYQISQYDLPFSADGYLPISDPRGQIEPKRIGIIRVHLEEDAGKSMHDEVAGRADSRIDLNRAGTPLLEIVSRPDIRSPGEAKAFLTELKLLLNYLEVSDCNMQEGSLRVDANINLLVDTPEGAVPTPIVEVKNMNSFRAVERALAYEAQRQYEAWQASGIRQGGRGGHKTTRGWDEAAQVTRAQRTKEESSDYRYFPDPDLVPVTVTDHEIDELRRSLGELPADLRQRLARTYGLNAYDSDVLVSQGRRLVEYYIQLADHCGDGKLASNWVQQDVLRVLNERHMTIDQFPVSAERLGELLRIVRCGQLETSRARQVLAHMMSTGRSANQAMAEMGIEEVGEAELEALCRELVAANPKIVQQVKGGKVKAAGALVGQAKKRNPNVDPQRVHKLCLELIEKM
ncbi:MAG TPA: Asp-tRNA(Asn)/Glu-tRNA(Gln) amidotransferase subunit GatB [Planctomycetaceae bacterium]|nr:Asp-tRNA(Asn)/Glu-tRNA(Gln) amidotransferase subunit GatB [Planctomycetaceae bacterium]HIQ21328.1 Asp-tRNA(Asn)/Glu-tRNA(Gln) amidotransferase subunit GatB [Planctomycetota bacterium]